MKLDRVQFEENKYWDLVDSFIDSHPNEWNAHVEKKYEQYEQTAIDRSGMTEDDLYDQAKDDEAINGN